MNRGWRREHGRLHHSLLHRGKTVGDAAGLEQLGVAIRLESELTKRKDRAVLRRGGKARDADGLSFQVAHAANLRRPVNTKDQRLQVSADES